MTTKTRSALYVAILAFVAIALTVPFLKGGLVAGHDRRVHLEYQHFFNEQIAQGEFYPRWLPGLNLGRGGPIFYVQYPLPYYVGWVIGRVVPNHWGEYTEAHAQGLAMVLAVFLAALFTYLWCSTFAGGASAVVAAVVFLTVPYFFTVDLYIRAAIGEVWALALMPLVFYFVERRAGSPKRAFAGVAAVFGLLLLAHLFTAVLLAPVLLAYAAWRAEPSKRGMAIVEMCGALALGFALAGVYTIPLLAHRPLLHPENELLFRGANFSPLSHLFPYNHDIYPRGTKVLQFMGLFARGLAAAAIAWIGYVTFRKRNEPGSVLRSVLAVISIVILAVTIVAGRMHGVGEVPGAMPVGQELVDLRAHIFLGTFLTFIVALICYWYLQTENRNTLADFLGVVALVSFFMMTRWSAFLWNHIHALWNFQFPWRFNVFLAIATAGLAALAVAEIWKRPLRHRAIGTAFAIVIWGLVALGVARGNFVEDHFRENKPVTYQGYRDEALPVYAQVSSMKEALDVVFSKRSENPDVVVTAGSGSASVRQAGSRLLEVSAECQTPCTLQVGQFYWPAWRAKSNVGGAEIPLRAASPGGLMEVSLPQGTSSVAIYLPVGWSERLGPIVSLLALIVIVLLAAAGRPRRESVAAST